MKRRCFILLIIMLLELMLAGCEFEDSTETSSSESTTMTTLPPKETDSSKESKPQETNEKVIKTLTTTADLNIRSGVGTSYEIIYVAPKGKELEMTGNTDQTSSGTTWYEVYTPNDQKGWCSGKYVEINEEVVVSNDNDEDQLSKEDQDSKLIYEQTESKDVFTKDNNDDLAGILSSGKLDSASREEFISKYNGKIVEFDCVVAELYHSKQYKTMYNIVLAPGDEPSGAGARFLLMNVNFTEMKWDSETKLSDLYEGSKIRIQAKVVTGEYSDYIYLDPVKTWGR